MDLVRFFMIFIVKLPPKFEWERSLKSAANAVQHLAVSGHGLNQILSKSVLHNKNTSIIECEKFCFYHRERCAAQPVVKVL